MLCGMASLESVSQKMRHAGQHWNELAKAVAAYLDTNPGALVEMPDSTPERKHWRYRETSPLPARIGLLAGDCLQNMRSALDYLVWELVLATATYRQTGQCFRFLSLRRRIRLRLTANKLTGLVQRRWQS
jgi:hypothetical protein